MRYSRLRVTVTAFLLLTVPFTTGGVMDFNPATEEEELILIPYEKEKSMGMNIHRQVLKRFDEPVDPLMQKRVEEIGKRLAAGSDRKNMVYHFMVLGYKKKDFYNAFAVPGGFVYIFEDLAKAMETDDRIAAILAHEMGHIEAKHSIKRLQASMGVTALMVLASQMRSDGQTRRNAGDAIAQLMSAYSRHDEYQADELSVRYLKKAGYDPNAAAEALAALRDLRKKGKRMRYMVYKSHPYVSERVAHVQKVIEGDADFDSYINITSVDDGF